MQYTSKSRTFSSCLALGTEQKIRRQKGGYLVTLTQEGLYISSSEDPYSWKHPIWNETRDRVYLRPRGGHHLVNQQSHCRRGVSVAARCH